MKPGENDPAVISLYPVHILGFLLVLSFLFPLAAPGLASETSTENPAEENSPGEDISAAAQSLSKGKRSLEKGDYERAIAELSKALEELPLLSDYALLWRAKAHEGKGDLEGALTDLRTIRQKFPDSPVIKSVRQREAEIAGKKNDAETGRLLQEFVRDYPKDLEMKYAYASFLKNNDEGARAKKLFKEIFLSSSPLSRSAAGELSPSDITTEDLITRGKNLNSAWLFGEAEKCFREAIQRDDGQLRLQVAEGLGHSLFRQKKYREAAGIYREANNSYWRARSLLRAGEIETFESELPALTSLKDQRIASVLLVYGTRKRREGNFERAFSIFNQVLSDYPSAKEEALWASGWSSYRTKDYAKASKFFSRLYDLFGDSQYLYWKQRSEAMSGDTPLAKTSQQKKATSHRDFYAFLSLLRENQKLPAVERTPSKLSSTRVSSRRVAVLVMLGLKQEAVSELIHLSKKNPDPKELLGMSSLLKNLGNYKMAIALLSKTPYNEGLHELLYPLAYWPEVEEASKKSGVDPLLILSVMREESRFDPEARSIAGALGLMQLMPQTAQRFNRTPAATSTQTNSLTDPRANILIGSSYLKHLLSAFESLPVAIAAYNAGEEAVREWLKKGDYTTIDEFIEDIPYDETRNYVKKVIATYFEYMRASGTTDLSRTRKYLGNL